MSNDQSLDWNAQIELDPIYVPKDIKPISPLQYQCRSWPRSGSGPGPHQPFELPLIVTLVNPDPDQQERLRPSSNPVVNKEVTQNPKNNNTTHKEVLSIPLSITSKSVSYPPGFERNSPVLHNDNNNNNILPIPLHKTEQKCVQPKGNDFTLQIQPQLLQPLWNARSPHDHPQHQSLSQAKMLFFITHDNFMNSFMSHVNNQTNLQQIYQDVVANTNPVCCKSMNQIIHQNTKLREIERIMSDNNMMFYTIVLPFFSEKFEMLKSIL